MHTSVVGMVTSQTQPRALQFSAEAPLSSGKQSIFSASIIFRSHSTVYASPRIRSIPMIRATCGDEQVTRKVILRTKALQDLKTLLGKEIETRLASQQSK